MISSSSIRVLFIPYGKIMSTGRISILETVVQKKSHSVEVVSNWKYDQQLSPPPNYIAVDSGIEVIQLCKLLGFPSDFEMAQFIDENLVFVVSPEWVKESNLAPTLGQCWIHLYYLRKMAKG